MSFYTCPLLCPFCILVSRSLGTTFSRLPCSHNSEHRVASASESHSNVIWKEKRWRRLSSLVCDSDKKCCDRWDCFYDHFPYSSDQSLDCMWGSCDDGINGSQGSRNLLTSGSQQWWFNLKFCRGLESWFSLFESLQLFCNPFTPTLNSIMIEINHSSSLLAHVRT